MPIRSRLPALNSCRRNRITPLPGRKEPVGTSLVGVGGCGCCPFRAGARVCGRVPGALPQAGGCGAVVAPDSAPKAQQLISPRQRPGTTPPLSRPALPGQNSADIVRPNCASPQDGRCCRPQGFGVRSLPRRFRFERERDAPTPPGGTSASPRPIQSGAAATAVQNAGATPNAPARFRPAGPSPEEVTAL